jgi:hypothetical protein
MSRARLWLADHPSRWVSVLEAAVRALNALLIAAGLAAAAWAVATFVQIRQAQGDGGAPALPLPLPLPLPLQLSAPALPLRPPLRGSAGTGAAWPHGAGVLLGKGRGAVARAFTAAAAAAAAAPAAPGGDPSGLKGVACPWFVFAFGAVGATTALAGTTALVGTALRSVGWVSLNVVLMCIALTAQVGAGRGGRLSAGDGVRPQSPGVGACQEQPTPLLPSQAFPQTPRPPSSQACVGVAAFIDHSWERRLPPADEAAKAWLAQRLAVVKWVGVGLFLAQLATLLLSCGLQSAYVSAEEAAEDAEDDAAWRRRPLLAGGGAVPSPPPRPRGEARPPALGGCVRGRGRTGCCQEPCSEAAALQGTLPPAKPAAASHNLPPFPAAPGCPLRAARR